MIFTKNYNEDYFIMTNILDSIDFYSGSDRRRMMTENGIKHPHNLDSSNVGESMLCTFGDYTGGETCRFIDNKIIKQSEREPLKFNGSKILHWVQPFKGTRYSLVFFHNKTSRHHNKNLI